MTKDLVLPKWDRALHSPVVITEEAFLLWLMEERASLIATGRLEKVRSDPARCPVNARFTLSLEGKARTSATMNAADDDCA
jgi:hypothetical protein